MHSLQKLADTNSDLLKYITYLKDFQLEEQKELLPTLIREICKISPIAMGMFFSVSVCECVCQLKSFA